MTRRAGYVLSAESEDAISRLRREHSRWSAVDQVDRLAAIQQKVDAPVFDYNADADVLGLGRRWLPPGTLSETAPAFSCTIDVRARGAYVLCSEDRHFFKPPPEQLLRKAGIAILDDDISLIRRLRS